MIEYNRCKTNCRGQPLITSHLAVSYHVSPVQFSSENGGILSLRRFVSSYVFPISCVKYIELRANPDILLAEQVSNNFNPHILWLRYNLLNRQYEEKVKRIVFRICVVFSYRIKGQKLIEGLLAESSHSL
jgi:hypothetical protein